MFGLKLHKYVEVVDHGSETQFQLGEILITLFCALVVELC